MASPANIYSVVVFDLHPKVKGYIDKLNNEGQIDLDDDGYPYVLSAEKNGPNFVVRFVRNGKQESFVLNSRKRSAEPIKSYDPLDGFRRTGGKKVIAVNVDKDEAERPRPERKKRSYESFRRLTDRILQG